MSQNFSKMPDIYIPELIELDCYWQKAVEDAIYDTLKGEKRLYYALRNRKKINEKLEKLGLKPAYSHVIPSGCRIESYDKCKSPSKTDWDSNEENSTTCLESNKDEEASSGPVGVDPGKKACETRSKSKEQREGRETPPDNLYSSPDRPALGNGSLEKMKKSQNSFYCEAMGQEVGGSDGNGAGAGVRAGARAGAVEGRPSNTADDAASKDGSRLKVEWLHFRKDSLFEDSDTDLSNTQYDPMEKTENGQQVKNGENVQDWNSDEAEEIPMTLDPREDLFWEEEVKNAIRENAGQERKLYFALAKREIVSENKKRAPLTHLKKHLRRNNYEIKINECEAKLTEKKRQSKRYLSPFIKFYLEVYKELCHTRPVNEIAAEAAVRWWQKSLKQKSLAF